MSKAMAERRIGRVLVENEFLIEVAGLSFAPGVELVRILPAYDRVEFGSCHWIFLAQDSLEPVPKGAIVPEYKFEIVTPEEGSDEKPKAYLVPVE
jgi:hypothetical protein